MNYTAIYNKICQRGLENRKLKPEWGRLEKHHIMPRHMWYEEESNKLTSLQHKEHILVHHLLFRIHGDINDKLAYKMMKGVIKDIWEDDTYVSIMQPKLLENLNKVDREKQKEASRLAGLKMKQNRIGIHAEGMHKIAIKASQQWAKDHPELASKRSSLSHQNRTKTDYIRMANKKSKNYIISPEGKQFNSIAEASYYTGIKRSTLDNWVRRGANNWKKIPITGRA